MFWTKILKKKIQQMLLRKIIGAKVAKKAESFEERCLEFCWYHNMMILFDLVNK